MFIELPSINQSILSTSHPYSLYVWKRPIGGCIDPIQRADSTMKPSQNASFDSRVSITSWKITLRTNSTYFLWLLWCFRQPRTVLRHCRGKSDGDISRYCIWWSILNADVIFNSIFSFCFPPKPLTTSWQHTEPPWAALRCDRNNKKISREPAWDGSRCCQHL